MPMNQRLLRPTRPPGVPPQVVQSYGTWIAFDQKFSLESDYEPPHPLVATDFYAATIHSPRIDDEMSWNYAANYPATVETIRDDGYGLGPVRYCDVLNDLLLNIDLPQFRFPVSGYPDPLWRLGYRGGLRNGQGFRLLVRDRLNQTSIGWNSVIWLLQAVLHDNRLVAHDTFVPSVGPEDAINVSDQYVVDLANQFFSQDEAKIGEDVFDFLSANVSEFQGPDPAPVMRWEQPLSAY
jgi:hypothetical protein